MPTASFHFGPGDRHECRVEVGTLGGETYHVDGLLVHRRRFGLRRECRFTSHGHQLAFESHVSADWQRLVLSVHVDGHLVSDNLLADWNDRVDAKLNGWAARWQPKPPTFDWMAPPTPRWRRALRPLGRAAALALVALGLFWAVRAWWLR